MEHKRIAVLADIHGNLPALEAVLAETDDADAIVLNGDIADGPMPAETLDRLAALGERAIWVGGNGDRWLAEAYDGTFQGTGSPFDAATRWAAARLRPEHRELLEGLPLTATLDVDGLGEVTFCHATARDDNEMILVDSPLEYYRESFEAVTTATVLLGHSHMPFDRLADRRRFVNSGSVGMGYGHAGASWAMLGPDVTLRRTAYDPGPLLGGEMPLMTENIETVPSDAEALQVFTETVRTQRGG